MADDLMALMRAVIWLMVVKLNTLHLPLITYSSHLTNASLSEPDTLDIFCVLYQCLESVSI